MGIKNEIRESREKILEKIDQIVSGRTLVEIQNDLMDSVHKTASIIVLMLLAAGIVYHGVSQFSSMIIAIGSGSLILLWGIPLLRPRRANTTPIEEIYVRKFDGKGRATKQVFYSLEDYITHLEGALPIAADKNYYIYYPTGDKITIGELRTCDDPYDKAGELWAEAEQQK